MSDEKHMSIGVAWYRPEQWSLLRALSSDPEELEQTHGEWLAVATKNIEDLRKRGIEVRKMDVDVLEMAAWCQREGRPLDGEARATYVADKMRTEGAT